MDLSQFVRGIKMEKPLCSLVITDDIFLIVDTVYNRLKLAGQESEAKEFKKEATSGNYNYEQILGILVPRYVIVI
jgi:hypothetical protein